ncbi:AraC family transcriptional regulator [Prevotella sp. tf2-5]|uniref:helix-turn-helix domain-containing protein n=1 Tax=Prevotella sp. tf2-5 TaxID=1761889 RepID=UPI0008E19B59|nr:helix-turn-helix domain-containing protein [Prevotella sp. tf2-5]SFP00037.1 Helix-turn-helix domain-containing protein [Prevotella sp. tf2-5]
MTTIAFYQYLIHFAVMLTILIMMAVYLLTSRRNAFGGELVTDQRLRRKAGRLIFIYTLIYLTNIPMVLWLADDLQLLQMVSVTVDMTIWCPVVLHFLLELLQDRRHWDNRLLLISMLAVMPLTGWLLTGHAWWKWAVYGMYIAEVVFFIGWYIRAAIAYRRFLADNYADLEHKEVTWSWIILSSMFFSLINYLLMLFQSDMQICVDLSYIFHLADILFIGIIVWYIDHQQILEPLTAEAGVEKLPKEQEAETDETAHTLTDQITREDIIIAKTGALLRKHCEEAQLYLQHDLSLKTVAQVCNTNRTYLGRYFASQGLTYYTYINKLRINHFQSLYREALKGGNTPPTLQQLSKDSGFVSYNTFSRAFLACTGISVRHWLEQVKLEE